MRGRDDIPEQSKCLFQYYRSRYLRAEPESTLPLGDMPKIVPNGLLLALPVATEATESCVSWKLFRFGWGSMGQVFSLCRLVSLALPPCPPPPTHTHTQTLTSLRRTLFLSRRTKRSRESLERDAQPTAESRAHELDARRGTARRKRGHVVRAACRVSTVHRQELV